jgi:ribonuclease BN (tRNA processing enzyme)
MIIEFPGTRGEIEESSTEHKYHSSLIIRYKKTSALIDFGIKYNPQLINKINDFDFILITHTHPDHYIWTLEDENRINISVYLTRIALDYSKYKPKDYRIIKDSKEYRLKDLKVVAHKVTHSLRCPAVGFKIKGDRTLIYAPDILDFEEDKGVVFKDVDLLIADGSSLNINMVRRKDDRLYGHTRVKTIIGWCKKYNIGRLIVTHCGKQIVTMDKKELAGMLEEYTEGEIDVVVAYDGYRMEL